MWAAAFAGAVALGVPVCPSALLLRSPCPGCGLTRAAMALAQGSIHRAMAFNPIAPLVVPIISAVIAWTLLRYIRRGDTALPKWVAWPMGISWLILVAVWFARNFGAFGGPVAV